MPFLCINKSTSFPLMEGFSIKGPKTKKKQQQHVTFAPLPPSHTKNLASAPPTNRSGKAGLKSKGFRGDYSLGETARSQSDMIRHSTSYQVLQAVNSLQKHDFAFVKQSGGSYSYAILAFRSFEPLEGKSSCADSLEEIMTFVMCDAGSVKMLKKDQWVENVRMVSVKGLDPPGTQPVPEQASNKGMTSH